jgi:hypothetical protein
MSEKPSRVAEQARVVLEHIRKLERAYESAQQREDYEYVYDQMYDMISIASIAIKAIKDKT